MKCDLPKCKETRKHRHLGKPFPGSVRQYVTKQEVDKAISTCCGGKIHMERSRFACNLACKKCGFGRKAEGCMIIEEEQTL